MKTKFLILSLVVVLSGCNTDDEFSPTLPPITQIGANTFGCYINGQLLTPRDGTGSTLGPDRGMSFKGSPEGLNYNEIVARDFKTGARIDIHIINLHQNGVGSYTINQSNCLVNVDANENINIRCRILDSSQQNYNWYCSIENSGTLHITRYDFENRILSGTFSCTMQNRDNPNDIVELTQGRFDIKWDTLPNKEFP